MIGVLSSYLLKVTLLSGVLYAYYHVFLRERPSFGWNRFYLLAATLLAVGAPLLRIPLRVHATEAETPVLVHLLKVMPGSGESGLEGTDTGTATGGVFPWESAALAVYGAVALALLGILLYQVLRIVRLKRRAGQQRLDDVTLIETDAPGTPFSFFRWIFWDRALPVDSERGRAIFRHELAHVRQRHSVDKLWLQALCALLFPVAPLYLIRRELQLVHEYLADHIAARDTEAYARYLIEHALHAHRGDPTHAFARHPLARRIAMIQQSLLRQARTSAWKRWMVLPLFGAGFGLAAFTLQRYPAPVPAARTLTVVIDAGHGGEDKGAMAFGLREKDLSLTLAREVERQARTYPVRILLSRSADSTMSVGDRLRYCKDNQADLCVSLHVNADRDGRGRTGIESYLAKDRNRYYDESVVLGSLLQTHLGAVYTTAPTLSHREATHIGILDRNICPAVLLEVGYLDNRKDMRFITQKGNQEMIAREILQSITDYANAGPARTSNNH
ncbi:MAG TPA: N-acetylmuramoyl-L-alanine amidase [Dinghuibacter sp.]|uniref:N-acetylmuramoyl-L-alanine amidase n=1 Tax=Dinghuibacter sp. TaxID=2024697 RepID=UPI002B7A1302|nr:N-acetylmuramoyl-L-alanine amidase [Dinghuibacter sp.]HTJ12247.1 N-acetylmuramoyl-L-alanine amidase [Dinghuibacter sp.]